jgi:hypothetical protein
VSANRRNLRGGNGPHLAENPCLGVKITVPRGRRDRWLNDEEISNVLEALPRLADQKAADAYRLILCAAVRPCEASSVWAEDIVTVGGERVWQLRGTKMDRDFLIPLVDGKDPAYHSKADEPLVGTGSV